jgi:hypothetical protein
MLKITVNNDASPAVLELEGKLAGPWVAELENCWRKETVLDRPLHLKLCAVTFVDAEGKELLAEMYRHGAELLAEGCMTQAIVEEIVKRGRV